MAHAGLRREMHDTGKAVFLEQARDAVAIGKIELDEAKLIGFRKLRSAALPSAPDRNRRHVIDADHVAALHNRRRAT